MNREIEKIKKKNKYRSKFYQNVKKVKVPTRNITKKPLPKTYKRPHVPSKLNIDEKFVARVINRVLISAIILLVVLISRNDSSVIGQGIYKVYNQNINFMKIDRFVTTNLGALFPVPKDDDLFVNSSYVGLDNTTDYKHGVFVATDMFEPVSSHVEGIVTNVYQDDDLGNVVEIQDINNNVYVYAGIEDVKVGLYSRIQTGEILGIAETTQDYNGTYYLAIRHNNDYLDVIDTISLGDQGDYTNDSDEGEVSPIGIGTVDE